VITNSFVPTRLLPLAEVIRRTSKSRTSIYAGIRTEPPKFPRPIKDGFSSRWIEREVDAWIADKIAARDKSV
jgi:predicted DNA-binding transcriptional regulator AlpA